MHPEYDRAATDHAYITHNPLGGVTFHDADAQCSDTYQSATLPIVDTVSKHKAAFAHIHKTFGKIMG